ncbi:MAG: hypothetical protein IH588_17405 [Anaerolineales bacterium]|nr:hypothetical protein [Anaerolineales bacterium]
MNNPPHMDPDIQPTSFHSLDEFPAGNDNKFRQSVVRLILRLFSPPYFTGTLIWFLLAQIMSHAGIELLAAPDGFWVDPGISTAYTFLGTPFAWGICTVAVYLGYLLLVGILLAVLNQRFAFPLWMGLLLYHLTNSINKFHCSAGHSFEFINTGNCSGVYVSLTLLTGILLAVGLLAASHYNLIPWLSTEERQPGWLTKLGPLSIGWIGLIILLVGYDAIRPQNNWKLVESDHIPPGRTSAALAYDTQRSVAVLFGGTSQWTQASGWNSINDTWEWDGNDWIEAHPEHSPASRYAAVAAFDEKRGVTVLFGGTSQDGRYYADTWEWDGVDWQDVSPRQSPSARQAPVMYYDPIQETVILYGGSSYDNETMSNLFFDDVWEWDGSNWIQIPLEQSRRTSSGAIVFDPSMQSPMLMDGEGLWTWQSALWFPLDYPRVPIKRWGSRLTYYPSVQEIVLFGGFEGEQAFDDTWVFDGKEWHQLISAIHPPARNGHVMFFDQTSGTVMLFGGLNGGTFYQDMWELSRP